MQPEESCRQVMDPLYYDDHYYWQWYPYWNRQGYNADASTSTNTRKDAHVADPLCVPSDSDNSDGEMSPNNQGKDTTTVPSESLAKEVSVCTVGGGLLLERLRSEITPPPLLSLSLSLSLSL